ncbi:Trimeric GatFAB AmidoTransferase(AdT) complex subunit [Bachmanniomyces sp. S44760]|nr:Trimeric GatFAB AmidoTransferase(AdT) complex subunit [Bachmanniomyces sp. S44760]
MDEFGMGSHSDTSVYGTTQNPIVGDHGHSTSAGGSSGGSAVAVATGQCYAALGTDTGGSIRLPAAYTGVVGFKPSYGLVSRFGIIAYSNSLDTVGVLARNSVAARGIFKIIEGYDENDPTSLSETSRSKLASQILRRKYKKSLRIGVPVEYNIQELDKSIRNAWLVALRYLRQEGHSICSVSLPTTQSALSAYYVLAPAEASSNLAKYDNARYGNQESIESTHKTGEKLYSSVRGARLGTEVQRRILLGAHSLSADARENYFIQAQKVRRMVQQDFDELFALPHPLRDNTNLEQDHGVDVLVTPTAPTLPPALSSLSNRSPLESYADDVLTVAASLAGLPAISIPYPVTFGEPIQRWRSNGEEERLTKHQDCTGLQITAQYGDDENVFRVAEMLSGTTVERRE